MSYGGRMEQPKYLDTTNVEAYNMANDLIGTRNSFDVALISMQGSRVSSSKDVSDTQMLSSTEAEEKIQYYDKSS
ncbi:hypothetical protein EON65_21415 [archaeon]|nr:MAG: hypothetical protein EON65_21415 [archaeon]